MTDTERRRGERVTFQVHATLGTDEVQIQSKVTENLSIVGVFVLCDPVLEIGTLCNIQLELTGRSSMLRLDMQGRIARSVPGKGLGVEFVSVDLDCYIHLRNIIEYNRFLSEDEELGALDTDE